ncbi:MAG: hypothetical protein II896_02820 [Clostridia bacterium]|nr:hypothetical protein [Clostridia bacterium]
MKTYTNLHLFESLFIFVIILVLTFSISFINVDLANADEIYVLGQNYAKDYAVVINGITYLSTRINSIKVEAFSKYEFGNCAFIDAYYDPVPDMISELILTISILYPNAQFIDNPSNRYNCHSYAWYSQSNLNPYWINDPTNFIVSHDYVVSTGEEGDIIVYYGYEDGNNTNIVPIHSGIIEQRLSGESNNVCGDLDLYVVNSKWGQCGIYRHRGDYCPYYNDTVYVEYYRMHGAHMYTDYEPYNNTQHMVICECGDYILQNHDYSELAVISGTQHAYVCVCGDYIGANNHSFSAPVDFNQYYHIITCSECGYVKHAAHDFRTVGGWRVCQECGGRYKINGNIPQPYGIDPQEN